MCVGVSDINLQGNIDQKGIIIFGILNTIRILSVLILIVKNSISHSTWNPEFLYDQFRTIKFMDTTLTKAGASTKS